MGHPRTGTNLCYNLIDRNVKLGAMRYDEGRQDATCVGFGCEVFKSHALPCDLSDELLPLRVVYVVRDPRDVAVSAFHYWTGVDYVSANGKTFKSDNISDFIREPLPDRLASEYCDNVIDRVCRHYSLWSVYAATEVTIRYSDMVKQPRKAVSMLCDTLGLQQNKTFKGCPVGHGVCVSPRKGKVGSWRDEMKRVDSDFVLDKMSKWFTDPNQYLE